MNPINRIKPNKKHDRNNRNMRSYESRQSEQNLMQLAVYLIISENSVTIYLLSRIWHVDSYMKCIFEVVKFAEYKYVAKIIKL